jgi:Leucine-rich repeat (LRR) protein
MWTCPICHASVNVPAGSPVTNRPRSDEARQSKPLKRNKSSAAPIPVSANAGFELLEATDGHALREPLIHVPDDGKNSSSHTKIRKQLKKRNRPKGSSSVEIDQVIIADSDMNEVPVAASPGPSAAKPADDLPLALVDSQAALPVAIQSPPPEQDIPVVELASSPAISVLEGLASEMETVGPDEANDETGTTKKKKKKKKGESGVEGVLESHGNFIVAVAMVALALLVVTIGGGISLWKKIADQKPVDPGPAIAYLQRRGAHIERDRKQPGEPVIAVVMAGQNVNLEDIIQMKAFTRLEKLNLSHTNVNVMAIDYISEMKSLRWLDLNQANIGDGVTGLLGKLTNLEELYLNNTRVSDQGLLKLYGLKKLRILGIEGTPSTGIGLQLYLPHLKIMRDNAVQPPVLDANP